MQVEVIKITPNTEPSDEVIAIDGKGQALVGFVDCVGAFYNCESDDSILENVTHYIKIPKL